jgi:hypothetical protein
VNPILYNVFRTGVQGVISWLFAHLAILNQFTNVATAVEFTMSVGVLVGYTALATWLGTRKGTDRWSALARLAAKVMMLGLTKTPVYPDKSVEPLKPYLPMEPDLQD